MHKWHIAFVPFGKDSLAMLLLILDGGQYPLDEVVFIDFIVKIMVKNGDSKMDEQNIPQRIVIDTSWYNELIKSKARYDHLIDSFIASNLKDYDTYELNESVNEYYAKLGNPKILEGE